MHSSIFFAAKYLQEKCLINKQRQCKFFVGIKQKCKLQTDFLEESSNFYLFPDEVFLMDANINWVLHKEKPYRGFITAHNKTKFNRYMRPISSITKPISL